ncbi:hypothetical protein NIT7321_00955 [Phaeobacter italicus]|jgi:hypothetical protein|uniref:Uncharacterized protein n=1 Tax=Phaeobacter italicus TaxID=481446 RepID=A0A0H5CYK2_9RHOB|nr:hypothetical protein [Phaeobacter italicus]CRL10112.1 hypothetical protein NIT7321_00955 [Phaeobacter italicus]
MSDFEKIARLRRDLETTRNDLSKRISEDAPDKASLMLLHDRVCRAIKALSGNF